MAWRLANSLDVLRSQVNARYPNRSKGSDGTVGDASHQATNSDHNPNSAGVVTAMDITHDPAGGFDSYAFAETLRQNRDPRIKYVISNKRIFSSVVSPWEWRPYSGANAHDHHVHVSVDGRPNLYDDGSPWKIERAAPKPGLHEDIVATVFGGPSDSMSGSVTAYGSLVAPNWWDRPGVALPARINDRPLPQVRVTHNGKSVICPVIDVGPWNTKDPYWVTNARPQAESGVDMTGRRTNLAGIDLTPAAANAIDLKGKGTVDWEFIKENDMAETPANTTLTIDLEKTLQSISAIVAVLQQFQQLKSLPSLPPAPQLPPPVIEPPPPPPAPVVTTPTPVLKQPGTQLGTIISIAVFAMQLFGILPAGLGEAATSAGQGISFLAGAAPVAGATGLFGTIGGLLGKLFK